MKVATITATASRQEACLPDLDGLHGTRERELVNHNVCGEIVKHLLFVGLDATNESGFGIMHDHLWTLLEISLQAMELQRTTMLP